MGNGQEHLPLKSLWWCHNLKKNLSLYNIYVQITSWSSKLSFKWQTIYVEVLLRRFTAAAACLYWALMKTFFLYFLIISMPMHNCSISSLFTDSMAYFTEQGRMLWRYKQIPNLLEVFQVFHVSLKFTFDYNCLSYSMILNDKPMQTVKVYQEDTWKKALFLFFNLSEMTDLRVPLSNWWSHHKALFSLKDL